MSFKNDLKSGEDVENEILGVVQIVFPNAHKEDDKALREFYDIIIPEEDERRLIRIEIKNDKYVSKNFAFECLGSKGRNTGIIKTWAHYWIQVRNGEWLVWDLFKLKKYLLDLGGCMKFGGDRKETGMWVVPEVKVLAECPPDFVCEKGSEELNEFLLKKI